MNKHNVDTLGQVFTPDSFVLKMLDLRQNKGSILEPSVGAGAFWQHIKDEADSTGVEIDPTWCPADVVNEDFFVFDEDKKYDTIIGNPPYVGYKDIFDSTRSILSELYPSRSKKTNLYIFFIEKCLQLLEDGGEIIFITPIDFLKQTSSKKLNTLLYEQGTITHFYDYSDQKVFKGFSPTVAIWRFQKDDYSRSTITDKGSKTFTCKDGLISFIEYDNAISLGDYFDVKVGGVSGMDKIFAHPDGNEEFVCSFTRTTGHTKTYYHDKVDDYIRENKKDLMNRKIKKFNEGNWWRWGREQYSSDKPRIYVNCKTRKDKPFFLHDCTNYDGSVLAIIPKENWDKERLENIVVQLNSLDWGSMGFKQGKRYIFSQRALKNCLLPRSTVQTVQLKSS